MSEQQIWIPYCGVAPAPGELLARWNLDPVLLAILVFAAAAYLQLCPKPGLAQRRLLGAAWLLLLVLFVSPFCALTSALFSARVTHHVLLTAAVAPLIAGAMPKLSRLAGSVFFWMAMHALIFWFWHSPPLYAWALSSNVVYWVMQVTLLASAIGLWLAVRHAGPLAATAALLATMVQMGLLGALITLSPTPIYAPHLASSLAWGYSPLEDQQLAGLIMWVPGALLYLAAALILAHRWFAREARASAAT